MKSIDNTLSDYAMVLKSMDRHDLANEFLAYKTTSDKNDSEYQIVDAMIKNVNNLCISNKDWAKKYKMTPTDLKSVEFYETLNRRNLSPGDASPNYLRTAIYDAFHYSALKGENKIMTDGSENILLNDYGKPRQLQISENLENADAAKIRSFSIKSYHHGKKVLKRLGQS